MESVGEPDWASVALHGPGYFGETLLVNKKYFTPSNNATQWHVYSMHWAADGFVFEIDGELIYRDTRPMVKYYGKWVFNDPQYLILNVAWAAPTPSKPTGFALCIMGYLKAQSGQFKIMTLS